ncbi:hypothetical protein KIW84_044302, partial [Lathyrus oleraceus]
LNHVSIFKDLNHPNIVRLLKVLATDEDVYLVFENVHLNFKRFITNPMLSLETFERSVLRQALSGLAYSHNIVHTDIKPYNLLFEYHHGEAPTVKLCNIREPKTCINVGYSILSLFLHC